MDEIFPLMLAAGKAYLKREHAMTTLSPSLSPGRLRARAHRVVATAARPCSEDERAAADRTRSRPRRKTLRPPPLLAAAHPHEQHRPVLPEETRPPESAQLSQSAPLQPLHYQGGVPYSADASVCVAPPFPVSNCPLVVEPDPAAGGGCTVRWDVVSPACQGWPQLLPSSSYGPCKTTRRDERWVPSPLRGAASTSIHRNPRFLDQTPIPFADLCNRLRGM